MKPHTILANTGWTVKYRPWVLVYYEEFLTKKEAMLREQELKSHKGRDFISKNIKEIMM